MELFIGGTIAGLVSVLTCWIVFATKQAKKKRRKKKDGKKMEIAYSENDIENLVRYNTARQWINPEKIEEDMELHEKWLKGDPEGKQLSLYAEEITNMAGFKAKTIEKAIFSHCLFHYADLSYTEFVNCSLQSCLFQKCQLDGTDFSSSDLKATDFK